MNEDRIKGILAKYSPPLSPSQIDEIAEAIMTEWNKTVKQLEAKLKKKSRSHSVTGSKRGRTR